MTTPTRPAEMGLLDYGRILWMRRLTIALVVVITVGGSIGIDMLRSKQYSATASIQFVPQSFSTTTSAQDLTPQEIATRIELMSGAGVRVEVAKILKTAPPSPSVVQVGATSVAEVTVISTDPTLASRAANAYVSAYISQSQSTYLAQQQSAELQLQTQINFLQDEIDSAQQQLSKASTAQSSALITQLGQLDAQQQTLRSQLSQLQINAAQAPSGGRLVSPASPPATPSSPKPVRDALIAVLLGLILGIGIALLREFLDDRIKSQNDLERVAGSNPVLGLIPRISEWRNRKNTVLVSVERPNSPPSEAYRGLRTSIQFMGLDKPTTIIEVTSASAGDGKTTTAVNLAATIAEGGQNVILVSCDLRKPRLHEFFGLPNDVGFTSVLVDQLTLRDACLPAPGVERLWILPSGPVPPNPSELLGSQRGRELFRILAERFDVVVVDTPPVLPVTDAAVIATLADGVLMVCSAGKTTNKDFSKALQLLDRVNAPILGLVLNNASTADAYVYYRYGEGYGYGYGQQNTKAIQTEKPQTKRRGKRTSGSRRPESTIARAPGSEVTPTMPLPTDPEAPNELI